MSDNTNKTVPDSTTTAASSITMTTTPTVPVSGVTTRGQQNRINAEQDATDDGERSYQNTKKKDKDKELFRGKVDKMDGNVFQLAEESRRGNQFTKTLEALEDYATTELDNAVDLAPLFEIPSRDVEIEVPADEAPFGSDGKRLTRDHRLYIDWKYECETYNSRKTALTASKKKLFTIILLQCSQSVKSKVESTEGYDNAKSTHDCTWLLTLLQNICHKFEQSENRFIALINAKAAIFSYRQGPQQHPTDYYETFKELISVLECYGGQLHDPDTAAPPGYDEEFKLSAEERNKYMRDRYFGAMLIRNSDNHRYGNLKQELSNDFSKNRDEYPTSLTNAHKLLLAYSADHKPAATPTHNSRSQLSAPNSTDSTRTGQSGRGSSYRGRRGGRNGRSFVQVAFSLTQIENHFPDGIPTHFILLDSDSTVSIFCNPHLLTDIHEVAEPLYLETNGGGHQVSTHMGTLNDIGLVWYNPDSIANILSLAQVRLVRRVTLDTAKSPTFHVHRPDGSGTTKFSEHISGLYLHDASLLSALPDVDNTPSKPTISAYSCLQTVSDNKANFTARQIEAADSARALYRLLGRPSPARFLAALKDNHILNCPITVDDARRAELIYGKDVAFLKGKTTARAATEHLPDYIPTPLPVDLLDLHPNVTLCFDLFYVLGLGFSLSTSREIHYLSSHYIADRFKPTLHSCISADLATYRRRGFSPTSIHADGEFNTLSADFPNVHFTICSADDHVPEIERAIRTVKEYVRAAIHGMPFARLPRVLVKELISAAVRNINMLPHPDGVSPTMSPATIVTGAPKTDYRSLRLEFGTYVQVYDGTSNDTKSRTLGAIATNPTGTSNGDYYFMSLATGQRIHRRSWTVLPISDVVISRVEAIAFNENMPLVDQAVMLTEYDPDATVDESTYDRDYTPGPTPDADSDHVLTSDAYTDESDDDSTDDNGHHPDFDDAPPAFIPTGTLPCENEERTDSHPIANTNDIPTAVENEERIPTAVENEERIESEEPQPIPNEERNDVLPVLTALTNILPVLPVPIDAPPVPVVPTDILPVLPVPTRTTHVGNEERPETTPTPTPQSVTAIPIASTRKEGLRAKQPANYQYRYGFAQTTGSPTAKSWQKAWRAIEDMPQQSTTTAPTDDQTKRIHKAIMGLMFTQMSAQKGIKKHGQSALDALRKEFLQFKALDVLEPLDAFKLTDEQKAEALRALSVIKEKRDGTIKGRTCADGSKQQGKYSKAETGSPTIANDALFLSIMIDAFERRDVATADIAGAYLHAFMKDFITMRFVGWAVDLLCDVNPEYTKYVVYEGKTKVLYTRCNKAIYGCVVSGLLWYELFTSTLEQMGFTTNPYDFCIANAMIDGKQCTIGWFVDDTKISHVDPAVVTNIIDTLETRFGKMKVTRGSTHKFLGMNIKYLGDGTATIHMPSYISEAIDESGLDVTRKASTPCASSLLTIDDTSPLLTPSRAKTFHSVVAKLIYVGTRARTDVLLALSFLCGRVSAPTVQDESKLKRLLCYLNSTIELPLRIGADSLNQFTTWVDASFAIHPDMRSHTGGVISFGHGGLICKSKKQDSIETCPEVLTI